jgi:two-component system phosphate regulon sensor histidine kinase PhoR
MVRNRVILLLQGLFLCGFLVIGAYILSIFQDYSTQAFRENCISQVNFAAKLLKERLPENATKQQVEAETAKIANELKLRLRIVDAVDTDVSEAVRAYLEGQGSAIRIDTGNQEKTLYIAQAIGQDRLVLQAPFSMSIVTAEYAKMRMAILAALLLVMLLVTALAKYLAQRIAQPLEEIADAAAKMAQGDLSIRLQRNVAGEFAVLSHALNTMADSLAEKTDEIYQEKKKLELIMKNTDNSVVTLNKDGIINDSNDQFRSLFGQAVQGQHYLQVMHNVALEELLATSLKTGLPVNKNITVNSPHGKRSFQVFAAPLRAAYSDTANNAIFVFHDITALQAVYEKQAEFVSNASHELATPLTTIKGFAETLLTEEASMDTEMRKKFLNIVVQESERMQALLRDLLQMARFDSEEYRRSITVESFVAQDILREVQEEFLTRAQERKLQLDVVWNKEPMPILSNRDWLKQILVNLLENALKYTPENGLISVTYDHNAQFAIFTVYNTGEGITAQDASRIFDRFYRIDKARTRQIGGTGLGLSIVKFIVEMFGGEISVSSKPGEGVAFIFTVPRDLTSIATPKPLS